MALTYFWSMFPFYIPCKHQKTKSLVEFSGLGYKIETLSRNELIVLLQHWAAQQSNKFLSDCFHFWRHYRFGAFVCDVKKWSNIL